MSVGGLDGVAGAISLTSMAIGAGHAPAECDAVAEEAASAAIAMIGPNMPDMAGPSAVVLAKGFGDAGPKMPDLCACVHQMPGCASILVFRKLGGTGGHRVAMAPGDMSGRAAMLRIMVDTAASAVASTAFTVTSPASVSDPVSGLAAAPSELLSCLFGRGLFKALLLPTTTTTLIIGCVGAVAAGGGAAAGAAAPLDAAPGVSVCATPSPRDRLREGRRRCLRGLRDLAGEDAKGWLGSKSRCPCAGLPQPRQLRLQEGL